MPRKTSKKSLKAGSKVSITWLDAEEKSGWKKHKRIKPVYLETVGIYVDECKHFVYHASTYDPETKKWSGLGAIPKGMIRKISGL